MSARELLTVFASAYPAQPATAFWRAVEIAALASRGIPDGLGLDLGCGDGILTSILLDRIGPRRLVGIDLDPSETRAAKRFPFYERVHTCSADAIPEPDEAFDFVLANSVLEHIPPLEGAMDEVRRVLKPGGRFFFTVPGQGFHRNLFGSVFPWVRRHDYIATLDKRLAHFHYLAPDQWEVMLSHRGLIVDSCLGYLDKSQTRRWESLSRITGGLLYNMFGSGMRPIEIQRNLGARALQNRSRLPPALAEVIAGMVGAGIRLGASTPDWVDPSEASCLLVEGHRE